MEPRQVGGAKNGGGVDVVDLSRIWNARA